MKLNNHDIKVKVKQKSIVGHIFGLYLVIKYRSISEYKYTLVTPQYYSPGGSFLTSLIWYFEANRSPNLELVNSTAVRQTYVLWKNAFISVLKSWNEM